MIQNYEDSLHKWRKGIWQLMECKMQVSDIPLSDKKERDQIFIKILWKPCGFCKEFAGPDEFDCKKCPLFISGYCDEDLEYREDGKNTVMKMIYRAWVKNEYEEFEMLREELIQEMKRHKDKFSE